MAKKKAERKPRADKYEEKVKFDGTLEQMIKMAVTTQIKPKENNEKN